ncbi:BnaA03g49820D [Brassica napus]|uniref:BnaA03g49820D protein n=1 Tax=Brassica napus TaxID=3708 RepID=A0A078H022_BRANA|nr:BnaA03g49820D [Brassica napus]
MAPRTDSTSTGSAMSETSVESSIDPLFHLLRTIPFSFLRPPRLRLKLPSFTLPSPMTVFALILLTYFLVISGFIYDVIVEPPGIGSTQDPVTGTIRPVVFMSGRVNGQYIIEGLSSGFMFVMGGVGIIMLDLALDKNRAKSVKASYATAGVSSIVIGYVMISCLKPDSTCVEYTREPIRSQDINGTVLRHYQPFSLFPSPSP